MHGYFFMIVYGWMNGCDDGSMTVMMEFGLYINDYSLVVTDGWTYFCRYIYVNVDSGCITGWLIGYMFYVYPWVER